VRRTKTLMRDTAALLARMDVEGQHFAAQLASPEAREAFAAFAEKRAPDFSRARSR
jgi:enoyl-CoA hydratase/carnithine racemase